MALFGQGSARPADKHTAIIEFLVDDVDHEYDRIRQESESPSSNSPSNSSSNSSSNSPSNPPVEFVNEPTTMPWGNRSLLLRDPDGNLVNLFTPVTPDAKAKFGR